MPDPIADEVGRARQREQVSASSEFLLHGHEIMIDQEARDMASRAIALIEAHDRVCSERQKNIESLLHDLKDSMRGLYSRFWGLALGAIGVLLTICGTLALLVLRH